MFGFGNKGKWIDVEKRVAPIEFSVMGVVIGEKNGVVIFQYNDKTMNRQALIKVVGRDGKAIEIAEDSDLAEMKLGITVKWPIGQGR